MEFGYRGSFTGFTFNNVHSSTLGITRISNSDRYSDQLVPNISSNVVTVPQATGQMYFSSNHQKREIQISFAFKGMDDKQLRRLRQIWNDKQIHALIFDECPYKIYMAQFTGSSILKYIAFSTEGVDYYNGEGTFTFTCYFPYAISRYQYQEDFNVNNVHEWVGDSQYDVLLKDADLIDQIAGINIYYDLSAVDKIAHSSLISDDFEWVEPSVELEIYPDAGDWNEVNSYIELGVLQESLYNNKDEWIAASRIPSNQLYGYYDEGSAIYHLYNAGDLPMNLRLCYALTNDPLNIYLSYKDQSLSISNLTKIGNDVAIEINMQEQLIRGIDAQGNLTSNIYNRFIVSGAPFMLDVGEAPVFCPRKPNGIDYHYLYY